MTNTMTASARQARGEQLLKDAYEELRSKRPVSAAHHEAACRRLPGGTTRARFWEPMPLYITKGAGAYVEDMDGLRYLDCNLGQGAMLLGHAHPAVMEALQTQAARGTHYGPPTGSAAELANIITDQVPGAERVAFVNSGTEATMGALRIARLATGRRKVAKFEGGWHGSNEFTLYSFTSVSGDPAHAAANPDSGGLSTESAEDIVILPFNDDLAIDRIRAEGEQLAAVIVEPVLGAGGSLPPEDGFLSKIRAACDEVGAVLIFDEVITGFRVGPRSGGGLYDVTADLTTLGKIAGGGMPIGVICGNGELMARTMWPADAGSGTSVAAGGTFSGNPMTTTAGVAQLRTLLDDPDTYTGLEAGASRLRTGLEGAMAAVGVRGFVTGAGSMLGIHFTPERPKSRRDMVGANHLASQLLRIYLEIDGIIARGLSFLSTEHTDADIDRIVTGHHEAMARLAHDGIYDEN